MQCSLAAHFILILQIKNKGAPVSKIKVKISGDGARMSHTSNLFVCSFAILEDGKSCLSSSGTDIPNWNTSSLD